MWSVVIILSLVWLSYAVLVAVKLWERVNVHSYNYYIWKTNEQRSNVHQHYTYEWMNEGDIGDLDAKKRLEGICKILIA